MSDILHSLRAEFVDYAQVWIKVIDEAADAKSKSKPFKEKLDSFLDGWEKLNQDIRNYLHACYLVHLIRVLGAFSAGQEFPRKVITADGYKLLKKARFVFEDVQVKIGNEPGPNSMYVIRKVHVVANKDAVKPNAVSDNDILWAYSLWLNTPILSKVFTLNQKIKFASDAENSYEGTFESKFKVARSIRFSCV